MSGHRPWSELTKDFTPERRRRIKLESKNLRAAIEGEIHIPPITLDWSEWHRWDDVGRRIRDGGVNVPNRAGVFEVKFEDEEYLLCIGNAENLRAQAKHALAKKYRIDSPGPKLRPEIKNESLSTSRILIRWAITDRPAAVEEELRRRYEEGRYDGLPEIYQDYLNMVFSEVSFADFENIR